MTRRSTRKLAMVAAMFVAAAGVFSARAYCAEEAGIIALPVPAVAILPGNVITEASLQSKRFIASTVTPDVQVDRAAIIGKVARRPLMAGKPIIAAYVKDQDAIAAGQTVQLTYRADGIEITGIATALQSGVVGAVISLRNSKTGVVVNGLVKSAGVADAIGK